jgi:hypothetical protein
VRLDLRCLATHLGHAAVVPDVAVVGEAVVHKAELEGRGEVGK